MLFLHETHEVAGGRMEEFGTFMRDEWRPLVEADGSARLLWCWELTHGTGASYQAITVTGIRDWTSWGAIATRMQEEPRWRDWRRRAGELRKDTISKLLVPASWSPNASIDLNTPPPGESALFLHDTGWPFPGRLDDYVAALGSVYLPQIQKSRMISLEACWIVAPGTGKHHEAILLQKILDWPRFTELLARGEQGAQRGGWMVEGLRYRDRWESKLLRTASWSPR